MPLQDLIVPVASIGLLGAMAVKQATVGKSSQMRTASAPGFLAHWRAGRGVKHPRQGVSIGYQSGLAQVSLSAKELGRHIVVWGATGVGKTTLIALLSQGFADIGAVIVLDGKGNSGDGSLQQWITAARGKVWTIGGTSKLDLLDKDPTVLAEQLTEAARHEGPSEVFSESAARAIQWIGWVLKWQDKTPTLELVEDLLQPDKLRAALQDYKAEPRVRIWLQELDEISSVELSGMATALMRVTRLIDSAAGPSLGIGTDAIRLEDVIDTGSTLLISTDSRTYPGLSRIVGGWVLVAMQRACATVPAGKKVLMIVDEIASFHGMAKHIEPLLATARDAGVGVVLAAHGPGELENAHKGLAGQVLGLVTTQLVMRVGDTKDADQLSTFFPLRTDEPVALGVYAHGVPSVTRDQLIALGVGNCYYHVAPTTARDGIRWGRARVALPRKPGALPLEVVQPAELAAETGDFELTETYREAAEPADTGPPDQDHDEGEHGPPEKRQDELKRLMYARIKKRDGYREWRGSFDTQKGYPRLWLQRSSWNGKLRKWVGSWCPVHRLVYGWEQGQIPRGWTIDHVCGLKWCLDHLEAVTRPENTRRDAERKRGERTTGHPEPVQQPLEEVAVESMSQHAVGQFAIALFAGYNQPTVEQRTVGLDELRRLLSRFEVLADKRHGHCWSPTLYAEGHTRRANAGVASVSALVFDMDKVPPDPERLTGVYWIGHTTCSHTPAAPRWRVVIPLAEPVPATSWGDVWRRARGALCPEADPACKDPSRAYWLPSHAGGVTAKATCHDGPLLDAAMLPELPAEQRAELVRSPSAQRPRKTTDADQRRGEAYLERVVANLQSERPGGRNAALNRAAWTLGRWIAAGALDQIYVEEELIAAAEAVGLVADDGARQCWATLRSGLSKGLLEPIDLDTDR